ncbi:MAG: NlpC/P60 family protein [Hyphomicrobiaceae bacterium]
MTSAAAPLDPRRHAFRPDLACEGLRGRVDAARFVQGEPCQVARSAVPLRGRPDATAGIDTEALFGERARLLEAQNGWAWVQLMRDRYVGYAPLAAFTQEVVEPTHRVRSLGTFVYPGPDIKLPPMMHLSLGSELCVSGASGDFMELKTGGFIVPRHVCECSRHVRDFVEIAERLIGTPYLWGGRTRIGLDCSGLVQVAMEAAGLAAPRDSDMQRDEVGVPVTLQDDFEGMQRGDLVFWRGHVGIMADAVMMVHANAHHMAVALETLPEATERIARAGGGPIVAIKRVGALSAAGGVA